MPSTLTPTLKPCPSLFPLPPSLPPFSRQVRTIGKSLPSMANLVSFLLLFFFIWSVLGVTLYGAMCKDGDESFEPALRGARCTLVNPDMVLPYQVRGCE
jgi:hypothetical protein